MYVKSKTYAGCGRKCTNTYNFYKELQLMITLLPRDWHMIDLDSIVHIIHITCVVHSNLCTTLCC